MTLMSVPQPIQRKAPREPVHGVLLLDKPLGLSSNDALMRARRLLQAEKAGHGGTLDPLASGLLPLAFGEATKFADDLLGADKTYVAGLRLGQVTSTGDREGEILEVHPLPPGVPDEAVLEAALSSFRGPILQVPPMHSALKKEGKALYEYARAGQSVEREARPVVIHALTQVSSALEQHPQSYAVLEGHPVVHLLVTCSKGTYIRVLGEDIGRALGCGAHLASLRRTQVAQLSVAGAITLEALEALTLQERRARLLPVDTLLSSLPQLMLDDGQMRRLLQGQKLSPHVFLASLRTQRPDLPGATWPVVCRATGPAGQLLGTVELDPQALRPRRLVRMVLHNSPDGEPATALVAATRVAD